LRGERRARLGTAPDRHFHHRIMAQGIVIDAVFVAAADPEHARFDDRKRSFNGFCFGSF